MHIVTTDPELNRNELFRTPLRTNYMGMKCFGLPLTALGADSLLSEPSSKTQRWAGVIFRRKNIPGVVLRTTFSLRKPGWQEQPGGIGAGDFAMIDLCSIAL